MKILITHRMLALPEGSETATYTLARILKKEHEVSVYTPKGGEVSRLLLDNGIPVLNALNPEEKFDIIHLQHRSCMEAVRQAYPDIPKVWISNGPISEELPFGFEKEISRYIAVSEETADKLMQSGISHKKIQVIWNAVDTLRFSASKEIDEDPEPLLVLSHRFKRGRFGRVRIVGRRSDGPFWEIEKILQNYHSVATAGRGCLEAMSMGRAVIVLGPHGIDGLITPLNWRLYIGRNFSGRTNRLPKTVKQLYCCLEQYDKELGSFGRSLIEKNFNILTAAEKYVSIYNKTLN